MIYQVPRLNDADQAVLGLIDEQRRQLQHFVSQSPTRWQGSLRRSTLARVLQGSNSIEGYDANLDEAAVIVDEEKPETIEDETYRALVGYRNCMTYILRMHNDPHFSVDAQVIRSMHFMMLNYDLTKMPGQWRPGHVFVVSEPTGVRVYEGPDFDLVPDLVAELVRQIAAHKEIDPLVLGAMAHLNLVMIHPFRDGNGRMARALQTLVLARSGILSPVFSSIEEWLGRNTPDYYKILADTGEGKWNPGNEALSWVRFCLKAHYQQSATILRRNREYGAVWEEISAILKHSSLPNRMDIALVEAAFGFKIRNSRYREQSEVSEVVASRDLKKLCEIGLLEPIGDKRGRHYIGSKQLFGIRMKWSQPRKPLSDPYDLIGATQPSLL